MDQATKYLLPLLQYLVNGTTFNQADLDARCADLERVWTTIQFPSNATASEVIDYYNRWIRNECPDDPILQNTELYVFLRYFILVCALDTYGPCETADGMRSALERGRQHLAGGLADSLQRMEPWRRFLDAYGGSSEPLLDWIVNVDHPTWFTKLGRINPEEEMEIRERWREILLISLASTCPASRTYQT